MLVLRLNVVTYLLLLAIAARVLGAGGWTLVDVILFVCFAFGTPWTVLGFWNALIGLWLLHVPQEPDRRSGPVCGRRRQADAADASRPRSS